jgi:hypothetical protein
MTTFMPISELTPEVAHDILRDCLGGAGTVIPGSHFREELRKEGLTIPDAWQVLRTGCIFKPPEPDIKTGEWKYTVEGFAPDGTWLAIVFSFKHVNAAYLITVFSVETKRRTV